MQTFEQYLEEIFCRQYDGLDDEMPDCMGDWFADLDPADVIDWAQKWGKEQYIQGQIAAIRESKKIVKEVFEEDQNNVGA